VGWSKDEGTDGAGEVGLLGRLPKLSIYGFRTWEQLAPQSQTAVDSHS